MGSAAAVGLHAAWLGWRMRLVAAGGLLLLAGSPLLAQPYEINWHTVDGGGGQGSSGGTYDVAGTAGQPDASYALTGGSYDLAGGFWAILGVPGGGPSADLSITKTNGTATSVPGLPVTYSIVAGNAVGPDPVSGATVTDTLPAALVGATWTCVGAGGATCSPSGSGGINDSADLPVGGTATYTLTATVDPAASGALDNTATVTGPLGSGDPDPSNNSATDSDSLTPQADVSASKTDGQTTVLPGAPVTYTMIMSNPGPSVVGGASVTDSVPAALLGATWTCTASPGSTCAAGGAGSINDTIDLLVAGTATYTLTGTLDAAATGTLVNTVTVTAPAGTDPNPANDSATDTDTILAVPLAEGELNHGYGRQHDLAAQPGPVADVDLFRIFQRPHASYEVLVDGISGDIGSGSGPLLERLDSDGSTVLQAAGTPGAGGSRNLLFMNALDTPVSDQLVRVQSAGCTTGCDPGDVYRLSAWETTGVISRFNNSGTQVTVLVLQNTGDTPMDVDIRLWSGTGAALGGPAIQTLGPHQAFVLNTSTIATGSGSITVANTGRYGQLAGKAVAVEPATGFTFDTELSPRPR